jgi:hypothetical protein
MHEHAALE